MAFPLLLNEFLWPGEHKLLNFLRTFAFSLCGLWRDSPWRAFQALFTTPFTDQWLLSTLPLRTCNIGVDFIRFMSCNLTLLPRSMCSVGFWITNVLCEICCKCCQLFCTQLGSAYLGLNHISQHSHSIKLWVMRTFRPSKPFSDKSPFSERRQDETMCNINT